MTELNNNNDGINTVAQSFFFILIFLSLLSDTYIMLNNIVEKKYVKNKIEYIKNIYNLTKNLLLNKYEENNNCIMINSNLNINEDIKKDINELNKLNDINELNELNNIKELIDKNSYELDPIEKENLKKNLELLNENELKDIIKNNYDELLKDDNNIKKKTKKKIKNNINQNK